MPPLEKDKDWEFDNRKSKVDDDWQIVDESMRASMLQEEIRKPRGTLTLKDIKERISKEKIPYFKSISRLDLLNAKSIAKTPIQKLNVFGEVTNILKSEISDFWEGVDVAPDKLSLDGD